MDQSKLLIPSLLHVAKSYSGAWKLRTHLTGVLNHGRETLAFLDVFQWLHDSNYTMNVLLRTLKRMDYIPDKLRLQIFGQLLAREQESVCNCFSRPACKT